MARYTLKYILLEYDVTENDNFLFKLACQEGYTYLVELLLSGEQSIDEHTHRRSVSSTHRDEDMTQSSACSLCIPLCRDNSIELSLSARSQHTKSIIEPHHLNENRVRDSDLRDVVHKLDQAKIRARTTSLKHISFVSQAQ